MEKSRNTVNTINLLIGMEKQCRPRLLTEIAFDIDPCLDWTELFFLVNFDFNLNPDELSFDPNFGSLNT